MGRSPCCDGEAAVKKGPWTPEEDKILVGYIEKHGLGSWSVLPGKAGLNRCGKSCRLRWTNYLRPDIKRGRFSDEEERLIIQLHSHIGNKWSAMAARLPGRTDNEIKNYWNTHLKKKLLRAGVDPVTHRPRADLAVLANILCGTASLGFSGPSAWESSCNGAPLGRTQQLADSSAQLARLHLLQTVVRAIVARAPASNSDLVIRAMQASTPLWNGPLSAGSLLQYGPKFLQGLLLDGTTLGAAVLDAGVDLSSLAAGRINDPQDLHLVGRSCGDGLLISPGNMMSSTPEASTCIDNSYGVIDHLQAVPKNSYNTPTAASSANSIASASPEHAPVDHRPAQETMNADHVSVHDNVSTAAPNSWSDYFSEALSDPDWLDFLDDEIPPSWRRTE